MRLEAKSLKNKSKKTIRLEFTQIRWFLWQSGRRLVHASGGRTQGPHSFKLKPRVLPDSSPFRSDGSCGSQAGGWTSCQVAKNAQRESQKTTLGSQRIERKTDRVTA